MQDSTYVKTICALYFYREVYYNLEEKLTNKYWYSEFDSSKNDSYKYKAQQKYNSLKNKTNTEKEYLGAFIIEYVNKNKLKDEDIFDLEFYHHIGNLKPKKFDKNINTEAIIEVNIDVYNDIRYEYYNWYNEQIEKYLKQKEEAMKHYDFSFFK